MLLIRNLFLVIGILTLPMGYVSAEPDCSKEVLLPFFPKAFMNGIFNKYNIPAEKQNKILKELAAKDKQIIGTLKERAEKMNPNPLKDHTRRDEANALFVQVWSEAFTQVLKDNGITDQNQINAMFDDLKQQRDARFSLCFPEDEN